MVAFDFVDGSAWEISCPPVFGFFSRLLGRNEDKELSALIKALHETMEINSRVKEMHWHPSYADKSCDSPRPVYVG
jgi:hypothetical protein